MRHVLRKLSETIPVTGRRGHQGYAILRVPHCVDNGRTDGGKVVGLTYGLRYTPLKQYSSASGTNFW
jgi:hypothetical protein